MFQNFHRIEPAYFLFLSAMLNAKKARLNGGKNVEIPFWRATPRDRNCKKSAKKLKSSWVRDQTRARIYEISVQTRWERIRDKATLSWTNKLKWWTKRIKHSLQMTSQMLVCQDQHVAENPLREQFYLPTIVAKLSNTSFRNLSSLFGLYFPNWLINEGKTDLITKGHVSTCWLCTCVTNLSTKQQKQDPVLISTLSVMTEWPWITEEPIGESRWASGNSLVKTRTKSWFC